MPTIEINTDNYQAIHPLNDGEHRFMVTKAELKDTKNKDRQYINLQLSCQDDEMTPDVYYMLSLPTGNDPKKDSMAIDRLKQFFEAIGMPFSGSFEVESFEGKKFWAITKTGDDGRGNAKSEIASLISGNR